jgi:hypothetical protein
MSQSYQNYLEISRIFVFGAVLLEIGRKTGLLVPHLSAKTYFAQTVTARPS